MISQLVAERLPTRLPRHVFAIVVIFTGDGAGDGVGGRDVAEQPIGCDGFGGLVDLGLGTITARNKRVLAYDCIGIDADSG